MALLYGIPLILGSVGTYFAGSMFDESEESTTTPTDSAASILSPQSTESAPGASSNVNVTGAPNTNTSSFMPSINITTPSFMGGPAQQPQQSSWFGGPARPQSSWFGGPTYPPQQQSSFFGGPTVPPQQQSSFFGGPAVPPQQQSSFFGAPASAPIQPAPTAVINSLPPGPELSGESVLNTTNTSGPTGPSVIETADLSGPTGPSAMDDFLAAAQKAKDALATSAGNNTALQPFVDEANKQIDDLTKQTGINALPEAQAALESIIGKFNKAVEDATPPPPPTAPPTPEEAPQSADQAPVVPVEQPQAVTVADVPVGEPATQAQTPQQAMTETVPEAVPPPEPAPEPAPEAQAEALPETVVVPSPPEPEAQAEALPENVVVPSPPEPAAPPATIPSSILPDNPFQAMTPEVIQELAIDTKKEKDPIPVFTTGLTKRDTAKIVARQQELEKQRKEEAKAKQLNERTDRAAQVPTSEAFGQSPTPVNKQGVTLRETRRAKAAELKKQSLANLKEYTSKLGGRRPNRWTHRRKR